MSSGFASSGMKAGAEAAGSGFIDVDVDVGIGADIVPAVCGV